MNNIWKDKKITTPYYEQNIKKLSEQKNKKWDYYGFNPDECYNLDSSFLFWLYPRLLLYKEDAGEICDLEYEVYEDLNSMTLLKCINRMIELLELISGNKCDNIWYDEDVVCEEIMKIFSTCWRQLWY